MRRFFQYTLDLFDPQAPVNADVDASKSIAPSVPDEPLERVLAPAVFAHPQANREVGLGDLVVAYRFERARRRSIGFLVTADGLVVRAPRWTPLTEVESALKEKSAWIRRKLLETQERQRRQAAAHIEWCDGAQFPYLGQTVRVVLDAGLSNRATLIPSGAAACDLHIALPSHAQAAQIRDAVQAWLMREARTYFIGRLDHFAAQLQVRWTRLSLSSAGTRWGSARVDGAIRLNWRLMHFTPVVVDYVVAHELSHLRQMNHGPEFWDTVRSVVPDYAVLRGQLKDEAIPKW